MLSFEEKFRRQHPDCRLEIEIVSNNLERFHVYVGNIHCADSGVRDYAFRWALEDIKSGKLDLPPYTEQIEIWPLQA